MDPASEMPATVRAEKEETKLKVPPSPPEGGGTAKAPELVLPLATVANQRAALTPDSYLATQPG